MYFRIILRIVQIHIYFYLKNKKKVWQQKKIRYLCICYPENNLFTLKELIPIEDLKRLPVKAIAFLFMLFPQTFAKQKLPTFTFLLVLFVANRHHASTRSKTQNVEQYSYEGCSAILFID